MSSASVESVAETRRLSGSLQGSYKNANYLANEASLIFKTFFAICEYIDRVTFDFDHSNLNHRGIIAAHYKGSYNNANYLENEASAEDI